jgi:hypothetical protein
MLPMDDQEIAHELQWRIRSAKQARTRMHDDAEARVVFHRLAHEIKELLVKMESSDTARR